MRHGIALLSIVGLLAVSVAAKAQDVGADKKVSPFEGVWAGEITGGDTGTWTFTVNSKGKLQGSATTTQAGTIPFNGTVSAKGKVNVSKNGLRLAGIVESVWFTAVGDWKYKNKVSGTWYGGRVSVPTE